MISRGLIPNKRSCGLPSGGDLGHRPIRTAARRRRQGGQSTSEAMGPMGIGRVGKSFRLGDRDRLDCHIERVHQPDPKGLETALTDPRARDEQNIRVARVRRDPFKKIVDPLVALDNLGHDPVTEGDDAADIAIAVAPTGRLHYAFEHALVHGRRQARITDVPHPPRPSLSAARKWASLSIKLFENANACQVPTRKELERKSSIRAFRVGSISIRHDISTKM